MLEKKLSLRIQTILMKNKENYSMEMMGMTAVKMLKFTYQMMKTLGCLSNLLKNKLKLPLPPKKKKLRLLRLLLPLASHLIAPKFLA